LHIFRHLAQKSLDRRQPACTIFAQSDKKSDGASDAQSLCGVALKTEKNVRIGVKTGATPHKDFLLFVQYAIICTKNL
jgi:hypothetical protein